VSRPPIASSSSSAAAAAAAAEPALELRGLANRFVLFVPISQVKHNGENNAREPTNSV